MNVRNLWTDQRASITVEFVFIAIALVTFIYFLGDLVMRQALIGRLDRTAYSIAGVLRERTQLYAARENLSQYDVDSALLLTKKILADMDPAIDQNAIGLIVEEAHFYPPSNVNDTSKNLKMYRLWTANNSSVSCAPPVLLSRQLALSPRGSYTRWVPIYQITVCAPTSSIYTRMTSGLWTKPVMTSYASVMVR
ncbi:MULTISPECIES: tight adherence pilus pseudopilin TadF [Serratia]|uniref:tight adherence pilus pseudopilin TadF n=1 Tax=Serratia TaxID=613 RepID=UPI0009B7AEA8|nr:MULTISPECIES: tight adherence pilus pseudopilin TadF [Serratia]AYM91956.1 flp pilus assembly surface protein TadF [Serratia sp. 3ACOL1]